MSNLRRLIRNLGRTTSSGMGFQPARSTEHATQLLVAAEVGSGPEAKAAVEAGAHVIVASVDAVTEAVAAAEGRPVGVRLEAASAEAIASAVAAGADFVVFDDERTPAVALLSPHDAIREPLGRVLILGADRDEERLRSVAALGADAILIDDVAAELTVRDQLSMRRISELTGAPLAAGAAATPSTDVLRTWRDAGAPVVFVRGDAERVRAAVVAAAQVPPQRRPRDDRAVLIPSLAPHTHDDEDDDD